MKPRCAGKAGVAPLRTIHSFSPEMLLPGEGVVVVHLVEDDEAVPAEELMLEIR